MYLVKDRLKFYSDADQEMYYGAQTGLRFKVPWNIEEVSRSQIGIQGKEYINSSNKINRPRWHSRTPSGAHKNTTDDQEKDRLDRLTREDNALFS